MPTYRHRQPKRMLSSGITPSPKPLPTRSPIFGHISLRPQPYPENAGLPRRVAVDRVLSRLPRHAVAYLALWRELAHPFAERLGCPRFLLVFVLSFLGTHHQRIQPQHRTRRRRHGQEATTASSRPPGRLQHSLGPREQSSPTPIPTACQFGPSATPPRRAALQLNPWAPGRSRYFTAEEES